MLTLHVENMYLYFTAHDFIRNVLSFISHWHDDY